MSVCYTNLLFLHGFQNLDDTPLRVDCIHPLKDLAVLASTNFPYHLVIILVPETRASELRNSNLHCNTLLNIVAKGQKEGMPNSAAYEE